MSRNFTMVSPSIWRSTRFLGLDANGRQLLLYLLTCEHGNSAGCYRLPRAYACADLQWDAAVYDNALAALVAAGLVEADKDTDEVFLDQWFKHCAPTNIKHARGAITCVSRIASDRLRERAEAALVATEWGDKALNPTEPVSLNGARLMQTAYMKRAGG